MASTGLGKWGREKTQSNDAWHNKGWQIDRNGPRETSDSRCLRLWTESGVHRRPVAAGAAQLRLQERGIFERRVVYTEGRWPQEPHS